MRIILLISFVFCLCLQPVNAFANTSHIHIFMYHEIGEGPNNLYVPENDFERLMKDLSEKGYKTVTASQIPEILAGKKGKETDKWVALTFDDGYESFYKKAYPILRKYNFTATVFIISDMVGKPNHMTWNQLQNLLVEGIEVGSHSETHPYLTKLDNENLEKEIEESKHQLESKLHKKISFFCYPYGSYDEKVTETVKQKGYIGAVTVKPGISSSEEDQLLLSRVNIYGGMSLDSFDSILSLKPDQYDNNLAAGFYAIDQNPKDAKAYLNRGMSFDNLKLHKRAIADYNKAIEINPDFSEAYNGIGWVYNELGEYDKAIANYSKSCEITPNFPYPYNNRGATYIKAGLYEKAIDDLNKVIEIDPQFPYLASTYNKRGYAYAKLGQHEKAIEDCTRAIELNKDYADAYNSRGYAYYKSLQNEKALADFTKAIELDPKNSVFYFNLGNLHKTLGQHQKAEYYFKEALELDHKNTIKN